MSSANILVVDDEDSIRHFVSRSLKDEGYHVRSAGDGDEARAMFNEDVPDVVVLDMKLGETNGLDLLSEFKQIAPDTVVIVITAFGETETAVKAMSLGAFYFLKKPLQLEELNTIGSLVTSSGSYPFCNKKSMVFFLRTRYCSPFRLSYRFSARWCRVLW